MKRQAPTLRILVLLLAASATLTGTSLRFTSLPANTVNGTYNGYISGIIDGDVVNNLICDDYSHTTYIPSGPYTYILSGIGDLSAARFANVSGMSEAEARARYAAAAILLDGLEHHPDLVCDYQYAIWQLFNSSVTSYGISSTVLAAALTAAADTTGRHSALYNRLEIYTPTGSAVSNQEFLRLGDTDVPEPSASFMGGAGLALLVAGVIRKHPV